MALAWVPDIAWRRSIHPVPYFQSLNLSITHHQNSKYYSFPFLNDVLVT